MENALPGLIVITILLLAVLTLGQASLATQGAVLESWRGMEERLEDRARTNLSSVYAETSVGGTTVEVALRNDGNTKLADFERWDVIVQYHQSGGGYAQEWLQYAELGGTNKWMVNFLEGTIGTFEPRILNPGEQMVIQISLDPAVAMTTTNLVTIATPNGISASAVFTR
jgi:hypothetical protein